MNNYLHIIGIFIIIFVSGCKSTDSENYGSGSPFGNFSEDQMNQLQVFAMEKDFDFISSMTKAFKNADEEELAKIFQFSLHLNKLDNVTRMYGNVIYSSLLNLGNRLGVTKYAELVEKQSPKVQQNIRDLIFFTIQINPSWWDRRKIKKQTRKAYPTLFPSKYEFNENNPILN